MKHFFLFQNWSDYKEEIANGVDVKHVASVKNHEFNVSDRTQGLSDILSSQDINFWDCSVNHVPNIYIELNGEVSLKRYIYISMLPTSQMDTPYESFITELKLYLKAKFQHIKYFKTYIYLSIIILKLY